jgi:23S rRNA G2445 N2-methylase RlmL
MRRLAEALAELAGLPVGDGDGDLVARVRRGASPGTWQVLLRTTPRPLATRAWREVDYPGAVNATIAATVLDLLDVRAEDSVLDMTCGSGTFLVEQLHRAAPARAVGTDLDPAAIEAARRHQRAARRRGRIEWEVADVLTAPLEGGFTRLVTNPPWGTLHGEHESNEELLAQLLERAAELAAPGARLGVLTHEITRMHRVLEQRPAGWRRALEHRFFQKGHHPRLFVLER